MRGSLKLGPRNLFLTEKVAGHGKNKQEEI
jgi:hypothetical protein